MWCCYLPTACSRLRDPEDNSTTTRNFQRAVCNRTELPVPELCRSVIDEVQQFSATQAFNDDVCLVAMDIDRIKIRNGNKS